jgi:hypothetical protein
MNIYRDYDLSVPYDGDRTKYVPFMNALRMKLGETKLAATLDMGEENIIPPTDLIQYHEQGGQITEDERKIINTFYEKKKDFMKETGACLTLIVKHLGSLPQVLILPILEKQDQSAYQKCHQIFRWLKRDYGTADDADKLKMVDQFMNLPSPRTF